jgi:uncharacterized protein (TIGR00730 family)
MKSVCVYCGSSTGVRPEFAEGARALARVLVERDLQLVYGGGGVGLMGVVADAVLELGGQVIGVIPQALADRELAHPRLSQMHVVGSMHERKALMAELSDAFIALPGGIGTLDELFEIWTWGQLGLHRKPCGLLNLEHFFDGLVGFLDQVTNQGFLQPLHRQMLVEAACPVDLLEQLASYRPPVTRQWIHPEEL